MVAGGFFSGDRDGGGRGGGRMAPPSSDPSRPNSSASNLSPPKTSASALPAPASTLTVGPSAHMPGSLAQYPNAIYGPNSSMGGINSIITGMYGPQQQLLANQWARQDALMRDPTYGPAAQGIRMGGVASRDHGLAQQALGIDRQQLGLDRGVVQGQLGNLGKLRDILASQRGLVGERRSLDTDVAQDTARRKTFDLRSDLTARGAYHTVANERGTGRIQRDLGYETRGIDQTFRNNILGLNEKGIGYDNQAAALNAKLAGIGLDSQRLGISSQQLNNALADGLYAAGLSGVVSVAQLADAMTGTSVQGAQVAAAAVQQALELSGLPPEAIAQMVAALTDGNRANQGPKPR